MLPLSMSGGPYIYDPETRNFVSRSSSAEAKLPPAATSVERSPVPAPARVGPPPSVRREKLILWLAVLVLFVAWLVLLSLWPRRSSSGGRAPTTSPHPIPADFPKEAVTR